jgi:hypothetical protein
MEMIKGVLLNSKFNNFFSSFQWRNLCAKFYKISRWPQAYYRSYSKSIFVCLSPVILKRELNEGLFKSLLKVEYVGVGGRQEGRATNDRSRVMSLEVESVVIRF